MEPSDYFRRQFYATFEDDVAGVLTRHLIGVDNLIWVTTTRTTTPSGRIPCRYWIAFSRESPKTKRKE